MNSAFLVGNRRNRYGWLMPARRATSSVEVPARPCAANSATAASRTSSRRSAAGIRCLVSVMKVKLVMTHYFVKGGCRGNLLERGNAPERSDIRVHYILDFRIAVGAVVVVVAVPPGVHGGRPGRPRPAPERSETRFSLPPRVAGLSHCRGSCGCRGR